MPFPQKSPEIKTEILIEATNGVGLAQVIERVPKQAKADGNRQKQIKLDRNREIWRETERNGQKRINTDRNR